MKNDTLFTLIRFKVHKIITTEEYQGFMKLLNSDDKSNHTIVEVFIEVNWKQFQVAIRERNKKFKKKTYYEY